jgi:dolichol-phosphate mannosyltransferase
MSWHRMDKNKLPRARTLTVVIPALNEEYNIVLTVEEILPIARQELDDFELILVNDGSTDGTGAAMDRLAAVNREVCVIHHVEKCGVGTSYKQGIKQARMNYVTLIPGDHEADPSTWPGLFRAVGTADLVIGYRTNQGVARPLHRVIISRCYTWLMGCLFGVRVRDFHSLVIYPTEAVDKESLQFVGYTYQLEVLVELFRTNMSFTEVPVILLPVAAGSSRSLSFQTFRNVIQTTARLLTRSRR